jgi:hypothetical protein
MASAIGISITAFQMVLGRLIATPPALRTPALSDSYTLPNPNARVDLQLMLGGTLFGAGWGLTGMCPGPAIVSGASPVAGPQVCCHESILALSTPNDHVTKPASVT